MRIVYLFIITAFFWSLKIEPIENKVLWAIADLNPPFVFYDNKGNVTGAEVENLRKMAQRIGYTITFKISEDNTAKDEAVANGNYNFAVFAETESDEDSRYYYSKPTVILKYVFYKRKKDTIDFRQPEELAPYTIGMTYRYDYPDELQHLFDAGELKTHVVYGERVNLLGLLEVALNTADLYACLKPYCSSEIKKNSYIFHELNDLDVIKREAGESLKVGLAFPKSLDRASNSMAISLRNKFNAIINGYVGTPEYRVILKKYGVE